MGALTSDTTACFLRLTEVWHGSQLVNFAVRPPFKPWTLVSANGAQRHQRSTDNTSYVCVCVALFY